MCSSKKKKRKMCSSNPQGGKEKESRGTKNKKERIK